MLTRGLVERHDGLRGYVWSAGISRQSAASGLLSKLAQHLFDGSARRLVAHLIVEGALDERDRAEIRLLLESAPEEPAKKRRTR